MGHHACASGGTEATFGVPWFHDAGEADVVTRTATCGCSRVHVTVEGEPALTAACHCDFCQKRTGSAFGYQAYFTQDQRVEIVGETNVYNGSDVDGIESQAGREKTPDYHFCPTCGSTVYWTVGDGAGHALLAIAVGNLVDSDFPSSTREYYTSMRHRWVCAASDAEQFQTFPGGQDRFRGFEG